MVNTYNVDEVMEECEVQVVGVGGPCELGHLIYSVWTQPHDQAVRPSQKLSNPF